MYIERAQDDSRETQKQWRRFLRGALFLEIDEAIECFHETESIFFWPNQRWIL